MKELLYELVKRIKRVHDLIAFFSAGNFNDKQLHFIVLGITGLIIFAVTFPIFKLFDNWDNSFAMASLYTVVTTVILTISMAVMIEWTSTAFIVPVIIGIGIFIVSFQVFKYWDNKDQPVPITNFFAMSMTVILAIAIEFLQGATGTGSMEFEDALAGIVGYLTMYILLRIIVFIFQMIHRMFSHKTDH